MVVGEQVDRSAACRLHEGAERAGRDLHVAHRVAGPQRIDRSLVGQDERDHLAGELDVDLAPAAVEQLGDGAGGQHHLGGGAEREANVA